MTFSVRFQGLVCHLDEGGREAAVFVAADDHELRLIAAADDIIEGETTLSHDPRNTFVKLGQNQRSFLIAGKRLGLDGDGVIEADNGAMAPSFRRFVPGLGAGSACIRDEVRNRELSNGVIGYFEHPRGRFSVDQFFPRQGRLQSGETKCVADIVRLSFTTRAAPIVIGTGEERLTLRPSASILIVNGEIDPANDTMNDHFDSYAAVLRPQCAITDFPRRSEVPCTAAASPTFIRQRTASQRGVTARARGVPLGVNVECSNSHIP